MEQPGLGQMGMAGQHVGQVRGRRGLHQRVARDVVTAYGGGSGSEPRGQRQRAAQVDDRVAGLAAQSIQAPMPAFICSGVVFAIASRADTDER